MPTANIRVINPVQCTESYDCIYVDILEGREPIDGRNFELEAFDSFEQLSKEMLTWVRNHGVTKAIVMFVRLKKTPKVGQDPYILIHETIFNPQEKRINLRKIIGKL